MAEDHIPDEASFSGDITDRWTYTQVRDWVLLYPDVSHTALHLYLILRSMIIEKRDDGLRKMTIDQLCWLLPGIEGVDTSRTTVKDALRILLREEFLVCTDPADVPASAPRKYIVRDLPPRADYDGWRNAWDKLDAYTPNWREAGKKRRQEIKAIRAAEKRGKELSTGSSTTLSTEGVVGNPTTGQKGTNEEVGNPTPPSPGRISDQGGRISGARGFVTCTNESPNKPSSSSSARTSARDASAEPRLEEDEEMKGNNDNPSAEPRAHLPQEREGGEEESYADNEPQALPDGLVDIPGWLATLPGLGGAQRSLCGFLEYPVMQALAAGWTLEALAAYLAPKVDPDRAHNKNSIPIWYANHLKELPAPPKAVVPLCDNPAHARNPKEDPVRGGCFWCNSAPKAGTIVQPEPLVDPIDMTTAVAACRKAITDRFTGPERSRNQMPHHRAKDEADRNRAKANDLLRGESGR